MSRPWGDFKKNREFFPDPKKSSIDGLVSVSQGVSPDFLFEAYSFGIFPWPHEGYPMLWFSPEERGVLDLNELRTSRSFKKLLNKVNWSFTVNQSFEEVINYCSVVKRSGQKGSWITDEMKQAYIDFHKMGYASSFECWSGNRLVGGLYGVDVANVFSAESMFFLESGASKFCLYHMALHFQKLGYEFIDIQMVTPVTKQFGGKYISKSEYLKRLIGARHQKPLKSD